MKDNGRHGVVVAEGTETLPTRDMPQAYLSVHARAQEEEVLGPRQLCDDTLVTAVHQ